MAKSKLQKALEKFRDELKVGVADIREDANLIKEDEIVNDGACDSVVWSARNIVVAFNELAKEAGLEPIAVPDELEPSPYQEEE